MTHSLWRWQVDGKLYEGHFYKGLLYLQDKKYFNPSWWLLVNEQEQFDFWCDF